MTRLSHRLIGLWPMPKLLFIIFLLLLPFISPSPAKASYLDIQGQNPTEDFKQALEAPGMNYSQFSLNSVDQIVMGLTKKMVNYPALEGETSDTSLLNSTGKAIGFLYNNQPSFIQYLAYEGQRLNLIKPAYAAAGLGWNFLNPILPIWTISRNISYLFFVVIFVTVGFMIMFRSKLNPQTVINIQLALPRIVVALIMVTFSYALSGLIVDVVYLGHDVIRNIITLQSGSCTMGGSKHYIFKDLFPATNIPWEQNCDTASQYTPSAWPFDILGQYSGGKVTDFLKQLFDGLVAAIGGGLTGDFGPLFQLIISFSIVSAVFKIFFSLLTKYVMIVLLVIFMPFSFLSSALSSQSSPIKPLKALLANTIAFPATSLLLALAYFFAKVTSTGDLPPFYLSSWTTAITGSSITASLTAVGILLAIPTILAGIDKAFESQPITQAASEQIAGGFRKIPIIGGMMG